MWIQKTFTHSCSTPNSGTPTSYRAISYSGRFLDAVTMTMWFIFWSCFFRHISWRFSRFLGLGCLLIFTLLSNTFAPLYFIVMRLLIFNWTWWQLLTDSSCLITFCRRVGTWAKILHHSRSTNFKLERNNSQMDEKTT